MKIVTVIGARPQFVKAGALSRTIAKANANGAGIQDVLVHTGQHYDANMSDIFFKEMEIPHPDYHLGIGGCSHGEMTGRMIEAIEKILLKETPDWVLVHGDTNSTLAGALAAVKLHIPIAHVEAGLRSFNKKMPEEINRILTDHCADMLFTPGDTSTNQLMHEGIDKKKIRQIGDVMYDAACFYATKAKNESGVLERLKLKPKSYALTTIHRAENTDDPERLNNIFQGLTTVAKHVPVVLPIHPRTKQALEREGIYDQISQKLMLIDPVGYLDMISLESNAQAIFTDSGGVQKEAYFFQVPCLTLRDETEWVELIEHGFNRLVSTNPDKIVSKFHEALATPPNWNVSLYGNGDATQRIVDEIKNH